jgi:LDH2 family malate/lactate/ureidoglycolate dehydrogenase
MRLSLLELPTLIRRTLLVASLPRGAVDVAARMIAWAEIEGQDGLAFLEAHLPDIERGRNSAPRLLQPDGHAARLVADGASPLLYAPLVLDLATAHARRGGIGVVHVVDGMHVPPLGWIVAQASRRGLIAAVSTNIGAIIGLPSEEGPYRIEPRDPTTAVAILRLAGSSSNAFADRSAQGLAGWLTQAAREDANASGVALLCADPAAFGPDAVPAVLAAFNGRAVVVTPADNAARQAAATRDGLEIDDALWLRLRRFGDRILIPNSERSRLGAG